MQYIVDIHMDENRKRTYRIDAEDESQALERLRLRLPPTQRDGITVDDIKIDPDTIVNTDPYGIFGEE